MDNPQWPSEPSRRRALVVLNVDDVEFLRYQRGFGSVWLNEEIHFLQLRSSVESAVPPNVALSARRGDVLIQNPYNDDLYEPAATAPTQFARDKLRYVSQLCQLLGAHRVSALEVVENERFEKSGNSQELGIAVDEYRSGQAKRAVDKASSLMNSFAQSIVDEFEGGSPDIAGAENLLIRTGLLGDPDVRALLELRKNRRNVITRSRANRKITLSSLDDWKISS